MTEPQRPKHGVRNAVVLTALAVLVVRLGLHAFIRVLDLLWIGLVVLAVAAVVCTRSTRR